MDEHDVLGDQRAEACQEILAMRLARVPSVVSFREEVLGGDLIRPDQIDDWIFLNGGPSTENLIECGWHFSIGGYEDEAFWHDVERDSHAGRLALLAIELVAEDCVTWDEGDVVTFVLTGHYPEPYWHKLEVVKSEIMPCGSSRIRMTIDPRVSIKTVSEAYANYRNWLLRLEEGSRSKPRSMSEKHLKLALFTEKYHGTGTWEELRRRWNAEQKKEWRYGEKDTWNFARAAKVAWERVTGDELDSRQK